MALVNIIGGQLTDAMAVFGNLFTTCSLSQLHFFLSHVNQTIHNVMLNIHNVKFALLFWAIFFSPTDKRTIHFSCNVFIDNVLGYIGGNCHFAEAPAKFSFSRLVCSCACRQSATLSRQERQARASSVHKFTASFRYIVDGSC
jgi:hypothetical protein